MVTAADDGGRRTIWRGEGDVGAADKHLPSVRDDGPGGDVMGGGAEVRELVREVRENVRIEE